LLNIRLCSTLRVFVEHGTPDVLRRHSATAHAAYHDLLRSLMDDVVSDLRGTPTRVERNGRGYWYDSYRIGSSVQKRYIGEDSEALRARIARHEALRDQREARLWIGVEC
jgi:hypothetical protein